MLKASTLTHAHEMRSILRAVDFEVEKGACVGLHGASGCGKTTLARILSGQLVPDEGTIFWSGKNITARGKGLAGAVPVQLAPQSPEMAVDPRWRVRDILMNGAEPDQDTLDALGVKREWDKRYPNELSGGELTRVSLARLFLPSTEMLICDEITAQLDALSARQVWSSLLSLVAARRMTLLVISHDDQLRQAICQKDFRLENGRLIQTA